MKLMLQQERQKHEWSQEYVSERIGVSRATIAMIESGQRKPSYEVLMKLEDLFGMAYRELFTEATEEDTQLYDITRKRPKQEEIGKDERDKPRTT